MAAAGYRPFHARIGTSGDPASRFGAVREHIPEDHVTITRSHWADGPLVFEVAEVPKPGLVPVLLDFGGHRQPLHLAESVTAPWIAMEG